RRSCGRTRARWTRRRRPSGPPTWTRRWRASSPAPWRSCSPPGRTRQRSAPPRSRVLLRAQGGRLVHGLLAALVAAHHVLRFLGGGGDGAAGLLLPAGELLLDLAVGGGAVAPPGDLVAHRRFLLALIGHDLRLPGAAGFTPRRGYVGPARPGTGGNRSGSGRRWRPRRGRGGGAARSAR